MQDHTCPKVNAVFSIVDTLAIKYDAYCWIIEETTKFVYRRIHSLQTGHLPLYPLNHACNGSTSSTANRATRHLSIRITRYYQDHQPSGMFFCGS